MTWDYDLSRCYNESPYLMFCISKLCVNSQLGLWGPIHYAAVTHCERCPVPVLHPAPILCVHLLLHNRKGQRLDSRLVQHNCPQLTLMACAAPTSGCYKLLSQIVDYSDSIMSVLEVGLSLT